MNRPLTPREAIARLTAVKAAVVAANAEGVREGGAILLRASREIVGTYQREYTGPAAPWVELADSTKADRLRQGYTENDPGERSGEMRDSYGTRTTVLGPLAENSTGSDDPKALWFEDGTKRAGAVHQEPRSVLGVAAYRHAHEVVDGVVTRVLRAMGGA